MEMPSFVDMTVSAVILTIAYLIATKILPNAFDRIMTEFKADRTEFLSALEAERTARVSDREAQQEFIRSEREAFLEALRDERQANAKLREEQNKLVITSIERLQTHLDMSLVQMSGRIGDLTTIVGNLVQMTAPTSHPATQRKEQK